jgi:predicted small lipoprotein YifL
VGRLGTVTAMPETRRAPWGAAALAGAAGAVLFALAACGDTGPELAAPVGPAAPVAPGQETTTSAPATTQPPTTQPPTTPSTAAPTTRPAATTAATEPATTTTAATTTAPGDDGDDSGVDWGLIALIAGIAAVVILLIALVAGAAGRRSRARGLLDRRIGHVVGGAEWVHDQASLDLMGATQSPERLRAAWADTRRRINDLGAEATAIAVDADDEDLARQLRNLSHALGLLAGSLDTSVGLRVQGGDGPGTRAAVEESLATVNDRRHELRSAILPLASRG